MPINERPFNRNFKFDSGGSLDATRQFVAVGYDNIAAVRADLPNYPDVSTFPDDPTLVQTNLQFTPLQGNAFDLTVTYSNRRFGRQDDPRPTVNSPRYLWEYARVSVELSYNTRITITTNSNSTETTQKIWALATLNVQEFRNRYGVKVLLDDVTDVSIFSVLPKQINKIHQIQGGDWLMVIAEAKNISETSWEVTYVWEKDEGTPLPFPSEITVGGDIVSVFTPPTNGPRDLKARSPYHKVKAIRPETAGFTNANRYEIIQYLQYEVDDNGWQTLPGVPAL